MINWVCGTEYVFLLMNVYKWMDCVPSSSSCHSLLVVFLIFLIMINQTFPITTYHHQQKIPRTSHYITSHHNTLHHNTTQYIITQHSTFKGQIITYEQIFYTLINGRTDFGYKLLMRRLTITSVCAWCFHMNWRRSCFIAARYHLLSWM